MTTGEAISARIREELIRRAADMDDPTLLSVTIVVKVDQRTRHPGNLLWRPEFGRGLQGRTSSETPKTC